MGAVADLFDRNGNGLIDWEEFIAALRPDWVGVLPLVDFICNVCIMGEKRCKFYEYAINDGRKTISCSIKQLSTLVKVVLIT